MTDFTLFHSFLGNSLTNDRNEEPSEEDQWLLWGSIVNDWENFKKKKPQYIKDMVRKGIPHHFRAIVWQLLCSADQAPEKQLYSEYMKVYFSISLIILFKTFLKINIF